MDRLKLDFLIESESQIESILDELKLLGRNLGNGPTRRALVARIFRRVHTLKGSAASAECTVTVEIAHAVESLLDRIRVGDLSPNGEVVTLLIDGVSSIADSLHAATEGMPFDCPASLVENLRSVEGHRVEDSNGSPSQINSTLPADIAKSLSPNERQRLKENLDKGARVTLLTIALDLESFDEKFRELSAVLNENGEVISTLPGVDATAPDSINFRILHATFADLASVRERLERFEPFTVLVCNAGFNSPDNSSECSEAGFDPPENGDVVDSEAPNEDLLKIPAKEFDELILRMRKVVKDSFDLIEVAVTQETTLSTNEKMSALTKKIQGGLNSFEGQLYKVQTVPVDRLFSRAARSARVAARTANKMVDVQNAHNDIRISARLERRVNEALLHLVRNAVSHGIEEPELRVNSGKDPVGKILLTSRIEGGRLCLGVSDDGAGLDLVKIAGAAKQKGFVTGDAVLSEQECIDLIMVPGFSTAEAVSELAGRGVGLDVVLESLEKAGGTLTVKNQTGHGTTFEMILESPALRP